MEINEECKIKTYVTSPITLIRRIPPRIVREIISKIQTSKDEEEIVIDEYHKYASKTGAERAIASDLILVGYTELEVHDFFEKEIEGGFYNQLNYNDKHEYVHNLYIDFVNCICSDSIRKRIIDVYRIIEQSPFVGRSGGTDKLILLALESKAFEFNTEVIKMSVSEIALFSHLSKSTVSKALKRLPSRGVSLHCSNIPGDAIAYDLEEFNSNALKSNSSTLSLIKEHYCSPIVQKYEPWHCKPIWKNNYLGTSAQLIYEFLTNVGLTINELSSMTGKSRNTVSKKLHELEQYDLVKKVNRKWQVGDKSLLAVANDLAVDEEAFLAQTRYYENKERYYAKIQEMVLLVEGTKKARRRENEKLPDSLAV